MPSSSHMHIPGTMGIIRKLGPQSILDVGIGFGKYGFLAREFLEIWDGDTKYDKANWTRRIDGIEAHEAYINPAIEYIYDNIYIGPAQEIVHKLIRYDLTLIMAVFEHIPRAEGLKLLKTLKTDDIIIGVPWTFTEQGAKFNNEYERHVTNWTRNDFKEIFNEPLLYRTRNLLNVFHSNNVDKMHHIKQFIEAAAWIEVVN